MKFVLAILSILFLPIILKAQENPYYPLTQDSVKTHFKNTPEYALKEVLREETIFGDEAYITVRKSYTTRPSTYSYYKNVDGAIHYYDTISKTENTWLPKALSKGDNWESEDGFWKYKVVSLEATINTPTDSYIDLLQIYAVQLKRRNKKKARKYTLYFQKHVGLIASEIKGRLLEYRVPLK